MFAIARCRDRSIHHGLFLLLCITLTLALWIVWAAPALATKMPTTNIPMDGTPEAPPATALMQATGMLVMASAPSTALHNGLQPDFTFTLPDFSWYGGPHQVDFWKEWSGDNVDVYVAWNDLTAPAESGQQYHEITDADIAYIGSESDERIWPSDVFHLGNYESRAPEDPPADFEGSKIALMIYNIRDNAYWSDSAFYSVGYFSQFVNAQSQVNAIFVDSFDWPHSTGATASIPYLIEGTVAHELAHLIQHDTDPDEQTFISEGVSELATQFLYGPQSTAIEVGAYLYYHRDSLTDWKGELFDYGGAALWQEYLWERAGGGTLADPVDQPAPAPSRIKQGCALTYPGDAKFTDDGDAFLWRLVHDPANGLAGIADQLPGGRDQVEQYFRDWTLANLLDGEVKPADSVWSYDQLALGGPDSAGLSVKDGVQYYVGNVTGNMPPTRKNVPRSTAPQAWGAFYRTYKGASPGLTMSFSGLPYVGILPVTGQHEWYSGSAVSMNTTLTRRIDGVSAGDVLTFWTWYDIEPGFDFGYVEASKDGQDWELLTQISDMPQFTENTNESTVWSGPGLTGSTNDWQQAIFSLLDSAGSPFTGSVYLRFRYASDYVWAWEGWYIDDIAVGTFSDACDTEGDWTAEGTDGWRLTDGIKQTNDWTADLYVPYLKDRRSWYVVKPVVGLDGQGTTGRIWVDTQYLKDGTIWGIVSNHPDKDLDAQGTLAIRKTKK